MRPLPYRDQASATSADRSSRLGRHWLSDRPPHVTRALARLVLFGLLASTGSTAALDRELMRLAQSAAATPAPPRRRVLLGLPASPGSPPPLDGELMRLAQSAPATPAPGPAKPAP